MPGSPTRTTKRPYRSTRRRQQAAATRTSTVAAATRLFADRGWSGTAMRDVAAEAGVSVETVYANFGSKTDLLLVAVDVAVVGVTDPEPLSQRREFAALGSGTFAERVDATARMLTEINQRSWGLRRAVVEGAVSEPLLAAKLRYLEERRRANIREGAEMVVGRPVDDDELDLLWVLLGAEVFQTLTQLGGRSVASYQSWLGGWLARLLGDGTRDADRGRQGRRR